MNRQKKMTRKAYRNLVKVLGNCDPCARQYLKEHGFTDMDHEIVHNSVENFSMQGYSLN